MLEQLTTLQVSAALLYRKDMLVKCSNVRNHFTWRAPELQQLADETVGAGGEGTKGGARACMWGITTWNRGCWGATKAKAQQEGAEGRPVTFSV